MTDQTGTITETQRDLILAEFDEKAARVQALMQTPLTGAFDVMVAWGEVPSARYRNAQLCHIALRTILQAADPVRYTELHTSPSFLNKTIGQGWPYPNAAQVLQQGRKIVTDPASFDLSRTFQGHAVLSKEDYDASVTRLHHLLRVGVHPDRGPVPPAAPTRLFF